MKPKWQVFAVVMFVTGAVAMGQATQPSEEKEEEFDYTTLPSEPAEVAKLLNEKIKLVEAAKAGFSDAIKAAEKHTGGKAAAVIMAPDAGDFILEVEVWKGDQRIEVQVDPATGKVLGSKEAPSYYFPGETVKGEPTKTESGLMYYDIKAGEGDEVDDPTGAVIEMHYTAWLLDGKLWNSSRKNDEPMNVSIRQLPKGWSEAISDMKVGGKRKLIVPGPLGFGSRLRGTPPNAAMIVDIELVKVLKNKPVSTEDLAAARKLGEAVKGEPVKSDTGLYYWDIKAGEGENPEDKKSRVKINYTGYLVDGTVFDSSEGKPPRAYPVGGFVPGFTEGLLSMKVGGKRKMVIPSELAYKLSARGKIPPASTLIFDVEMLEVLPPTTQPASPHGARNRMRQPATRPAARPATRPAG
jgi:FKBP-type peptidyl-prolyl cis-trans isomerase